MVADRPAVRHRRRFDLPLPASFEILAQKSLERRGIDRRGAAGPIAERDLNRPRSASQAGRDELGPPASREQLRFAGETPGPDRSPAPRNRTDRRASLQEQRFQPVLRQRGAEQTAAQTGADHHDIPKRVLWMIRPVIAPRKDHGAPIGSLPGNAKSSRAPLPRPDWRVCKQISVRCGQSPSAALDLASRSFPESSIERQSDSRLSSAASEMDVDALLLLGEDRDEPQGIPTDSRITEALCSIAWGGAKFRAASGYGKIAHVEPGKKRNGCRRVPGLGGGPRWPLGAARRQAGHDSAGAGSSRPDQTLCSEALENGIARAGLPCRVFPDGMTVRMSARTAFEPDALVVCPPPPDLNTWRSQIRWSSSRSCRRARLRKITGSNLTAIFRLPA